VISFTQVSPTKTLYTPLLSPIRATYPTQLIILDFINRTVLGEQYRSLIIFRHTCNFKHTPIDAINVGCSCYLFDLSRSVNSKCLSFELCHCCIQWAILIYIAMNVNSAYMFNVMNINFLLTCISYLSIYGNWYIPGSVNYMPMFSHTHVPGRFHVANYGGVNNS
jgi:hypothetical protein